MKKNAKGKKKSTPDINPIEHYNYIQEGKLNHLILLNNNTFML